MYVISLFSLDGWVRWMVVTGVLFLVCGLYHVGLAFMVYSGIFGELYLCQDGCDAGVLGAGSKRSVGRILYRAMNIGIYFKLDAFYVLK